MKAESIVTGGAGKRVLTRFLRRKAGSSEPAFLCSILPQAANASIEFAIKKSPDASCVQTQFGWSGKRDSGV